MDMLEMNEIRDTKFMGVANSMSRSIRRAISKFLNRLMMLPMNIQAELSEIIQTKLAELEVQGNVSYKSLKGRV